MKEKMFAYSCIALFLLFMPLSVRSQDYKDVRMPINQNTLGIVDRCDRIVMTGVRQISRGKVIEKELTVEDVERIEFQHVEGADGYIIIFVRDKENPKQAAKNHIGFIGKNSNLMAYSKYPDNMCEYYLVNRDAETGVIIFCEKGDRFPSNFYLVVGDAKIIEKRELYAITGVEFYEKGSETPSLRSSFLSFEDYSVNLFKYFWEKMVAKYQR